MAVLQLVPDLPHAGGNPPGSEPQQQHLLPSIAPEPAPAWNPVIVPPRADPAVLLPFLRLSAELALRATGASGCAIAMRAGSGFRCYASMGEAPPANSPVRLAGTLTGLCVRKGKTVRRNHVDDNDAGETTGYPAPARSLVLAPIFQDGNVGGAIGIFAPEDDVFFDEHVTALEQVAGVISMALLHPERMAASVPQPDEAPAAVFAPAPVENGITEQALEAHTRALEKIASAITSAISRSSQASPELAEPAQADSLTPAGQPGKRLYGLPCSECGAYFAAAHSTCQICGTERSKN